MWGVITSRYSNGGKPIHVHTAKKLRIVAPTVHIATAVLDCAVAVAACWAECAEAVLDSVR